MSNRSRIFNMVATMVTINTLWVVAVISAGSSSLRWWLGIGQIVTTAVLAAAFGYEIRKDAERQQSPPRD